MKKLLIVTSVFLLSTWTLSHTSSTAAIAEQHNHTQENSAHIETKEADSHEHAQEDEHGHEEGTIHINPSQIAAAGIKTAAVSLTPVTSTTQLPGQIILADDRKAVVTPRAAGTVQKVLKNIGDSVAAGETLAVIESPDIAEASAEYLAAERAETLTQTIWAREEKLWKEKVTAEQDYLTARNDHEEAKIRLNLASQKLRAAGQEPQHAKSGSTYMLTSPIAGRIMRRDLTLGAYVDTTHTAFEVADTSLLWVEAALPAGDLSALAENKDAFISAGNINATGKIVFMSPTIDSTTRTAKVIVSLPNQEGHWRAGTFATVTLPTGSTTSGFSLPASAVQTIEGKTAIFVQNQEGFTLRPVKTGLRNGSHVIIEDGISEGEIVATENAFILKAELGKSEAEHVH